MWVVGCGLWVGVLCYVMLCSVMLCYAMHAASYTRSREGRGGGAAGGGCQSWSLLCPSPDHCTATRIGRETVNRKYRASHLQWQYLPPLLPRSWCSSVTMPRATQLGAVQTKRGSTTGTATRFHSGSGPCGHGLPNEGFTRVTLLRSTSRYCEIRSVAGWNNGSLYKRPRVASILLQSRGESTALAAIKYSGTSRSDKAAGTRTILRVAVGISPITQEEPSSQIDKEFLLGITVRRYALVADCRKTVWV